MEMTCHTVTTSKSSDLHLLNKEIKHLVTSPTKRSRDFYNDIDFHSIFDYQISHLIWSGPWEVAPVCVTVTPTSRSTTPHIWDKYTPGSSSTPPRAPPQATPAASLSTASTPALSPSTVCATPRGRRPGGTLGQVMRW